jgi:two-component system chemotaxis response regulator CheY
VSSTPSTDIPLKVLIADDEADISLLLKVRLELDGFEVVGVAGDGAEALEQYRQYRPDVVVMDLLMPNVSGFEAIGRIRAEFPTSRIIAHTGVAGDFVREEMQRAGVPVLLKSGDLAALGDAIRICAAPLPGGAPAT